MIGFGRVVNSILSPELRLWFLILGGSVPLRYSLSFTEVGQRFEIVDERVENETLESGDSQPQYFYKFENGRGVLNVKGERRGLQHEDIDPVTSILAQLPCQTQTLEGTRLTLRRD